jgi:VanZ family protein
MALILLFSSDVASAEQTGRVLVPLLQALLPWASPVALREIHGAVRKGAHVSAYAVLAVLWYRPLARDGALDSRRAGGAAVAIAALWAFVDEAHQTMTLARTGSLADVALDGAGALLGTAGALAGWGRVAGIASGVLLVVAFAGGAGVIALNLAAGVPSGVLWVTVPAAALVLVLRRLHRPS